MFRSTRRRPGLDRTAKSQDGVTPGLEELESRLLMSTYYIATNGSDRAAGTREAPLASLRRFFEVAKAGDTALIREGTYNGATPGWEKLAPKVSGTAKAPIIVRNAPGEKVVIRRQASRPGNTFVKLTNGEAYMRFEGLTIDNYMVGFDIFRGSAAPHHITLNGLNLTNMGRPRLDGDGRGVRMSDGASYVTVSNSEIARVGGIGILGGGGVSNVTIDNVLIHDVDDGDGAGGDGDGVNFTYARGLYPNHITVRNTRVWNTSEDGIDIKGDNVLLENDVVYHATANAYKVWSPLNSSQGLKVQGRFTVRNVTGFDVGGSVFEAFNLPAVTIVGSAFVGNGEDAAVMYKPGSGTESWRGNVSIRNTKMMHTGAKQALWVYKNNNARFDLENNVYHSVGGAKEAVRLYSAAKTFTAFSNAAMEDGTFTRASGAEHRGSGQRVNLAPVFLQARGSLQLAPGQRGTYSALAVDPDGGKVTYNWSFGDGTRPVAAAGTNHTYAAVGNRVLTITATDDEGASIVGRGTVTVRRIV